MTKIKIISLSFLLTLLGITYWIIEPVSINPFKTTTPNYTQSEVNFTCNPIPNYKEIFQLKADSIVDDAIKHNKFVGASVGVYKLGCGTWLGNAGYKDKGAQLRSDKNTLHRIASISKPMTAIAIMQLVNAGKLDLDVPIQRYLPEFPKKTKGTITIRQLLTHTAGVPHYKSTFDGISYKHFPNTVAALDKFKDWALKFPPGTDYLYTTYGYNILGAIIEKVTGQLYQEYMSTNVWQAANMQHTDIEDSKKTYQNKANLYINAKGIFIKSLNTDLSIKYPAGGFHSTAEDLLLFGKAILENQLIDSTTLNLMIAPTKLENRTSRYGMGWFSFNHPKYGRTIEHGGAQSGVSSFMKIYVDQQVVVVIISNNIGSANQINFVAKELATLALDDSSINKPIKIVRPQSNALLDRYTGIYTFKEDKIAITREDNQLFLRKNSYPKVPFYPISKNAFFCRWFDGQLEFPVVAEGSEKTLIYTYDGIEEIWELKQGE